MKIARLEAIPVSVPLKAGLTTRTAHGDHVTSDYAIVRVHSDDGLVGLGEATVSAIWSGETNRSTVFAVEQVLAPALVGQDPTRIHACRFAMDRALKNNPFTKAAVEMALWDLFGKSLGVPVHQLLGGKLRDRIRTKMMIGAFDPPQAVALAERFLGWGVTCLKVKVGLDPDGDVSRVRAVREAAGPDLPITVDANCGWDVPAARSALERLRPFNLLVAEQPLMPGLDDATRDLRRIGLAIMADESVWTAADALRVCSARAADVISLYPGKNGGLLASLEVAHVAAAAGLPCHMGSNLELGIASAAMLHLAAACPNIQSDRFPADILGPNYHEADLLTTPLDLRADSALVPDAPGLGVELDEEQLKRFRADR
ncbi:mandelate racemase/muconate lactonizing enzyme family protein [Tautonia sociabilis]|uniref:Mandelate racemase/muconate lactonizing protein n=1 Tax=Tautonia sociabilis TaxID=2080755 RepID=A0A432MLJ3_9BACT|nr:enolase C-terminal domain-like protein [Tautonia sociabilis]RUL88283.1 mandelate racemase/muconate lactonizing protein [Tautonia sociabilis]